MSPYLYSALYWRGGSGQETRLILTEQLQYARDQGERHGHLR